MPAAAQAPPILSSADPAAVESTCREHGLTEAAFRELHTRCVGAKATAYCPYSEFRVGASLLSVEGIFFNGATWKTPRTPSGRVPSAWPSARR